MMTVAFKNFFYLFQLALFVGLIIPSVVAQPMMAEPEWAGLTLDSRPEHGSPPYTAYLRADLYPFLVDCQHIVWDFGDGQQERQPCPAGESYPLIFQANHTYPNPATYYARIYLFRDNGQIVESNSHTIVVALAQPASLAQTIIRWALYIATVAIAGLFVFKLRYHPCRQMAYTLLALLLITFVPPFSYLPNPAGIIWRLFGGYSYDPRLPYVNGFVAAGDPTATLRPYLNGLIGQNGLDPLDPIQPLRRYDFVGVKVNPYQVLVKVRFTYQDSNQRIYSVPIYQPQTFWGFYQHDWRYDGLGRLRTEYVALPTAPLVNNPFAPPTWLAEIPGRGDDNPNWFQNSFLNPMVWSKEGILLKVAGRNDSNELWLIDPAGQPAQQIAQDVAEYRFTPDGQHIVFSQAVYHQSEDGQLLTRFSLATPTGQSQDWLELNDFPLPDLGQEGAWYIADGALWHKPYSNESPGRVIDLPKSNSGWVRSGKVRLSANGQQLAYTCDFSQDTGNAPRYNLCLMSINGQHWREFPLAALEMDFSWSPDGQKLAVVQWAYEQPTVLTLIKGESVTTIPLAPDGPAGTPQWSANGQELWINAFPWGGRRILQVNVSSGRVVDLTPPRWDAYFALAPDGQSLVISSGRGSLWRLER